MFSWQDVLTISLFADLVTNGISRIDTAKLCEKIDWSQDKFHYCYNAYMSFNFDIRLFKLLVKRKFKEQS